MMQKDEMTHQWMILLKTLLLPDEGTDNAWPENDVDLLLSPLLGNHLNEGERIPLFTHHIFDC